MLTGNICNQVDRIWNPFRSGGGSNPLSVIEQLTFISFTKRLDDLHTVEGNPPFLMGFSRRIHAAVFSFIAGVIPPMPKLGRFYERSKSAA
ncbi:DNA methyltransferase [Antarctobacter heliothermus]|uniref:DNA methyltransferase n=1 Tax=Antarctobacter heliothermus TaxID=74033 RepID=A0A222E2N8_9RHOB|nr:hypothetical protein [Antarctobacter heliothermus]ASP20467.1 DNA methyltransferase [Antarctobacter heliothermus]